MLRVRLKADGRIVEILPDGSEAPVPAASPSIVPGGAAGRPDWRRRADVVDSDAAYARSVRARTGLTQSAFAAGIGVPIETVRNWEQGKRAPRGPARALLKVIDKAPDTAFAVLGAGAMRR
jgi:putative transcriptional regulator